MSLSHAPRLVVNSTMENRSRTDTNYNRPTNHFHLKTIVLVLQPHPTKHWSASSFRSRGISYGSELANGTIVAKIEIKQLTLAHHNCLISRVSAVSHELVSGRTLFDYDSAQLSSIQRLLSDDANIVSAIQAVDLAMHSSAIRPQWWWGWWQYDGWRYRNCSGSRAGNNNNRNKIKTI